MSLALICAAGTLTLKPFLRVAWPELAVECALRRGDASDPWGKPWLNDLKMGFATACHSVGPNGIDERGGGDDIGGIAGYLQFALVEPKAEQIIWSLFAWALRPMTLAIAAVVLGWLVAAGRLWSAARGTPVREALQAVVIATLPIAMAWWIVVALPQQLDLSRISLGIPLLVPEDVALAMTLSVAIFVLILGWRLSHPPARSFE